MLYLFLGPDNYSKKQYLDSLVKETGADLVVFSEGEEVLSSRLVEIDLFSKPKIFALSKALAFENINKLTASKNYIILLLENLDRRKKENKDLLANKNVIVKEFALPHAKDLDQWITNRVFELGGKILPDAVNELGLRLGRDEAKEVKVGGKIISVDEVYSLWQVENEIKKLLAAAGQNEITKDLVLELVSESGKTDAFAITNAIADKNKEKTFKLIEKFLKEQTSADEKGSIIQLNALLAEQFRNVAMVQDFVANNTVEKEILEKTGWKSGRLFIMKKISTRFLQSKVLDLLNKLVSLDQEMKTSQIPPKVLLDLVLAQLF